MRIIPAIDIIGGKCVRLTRGDYHSEKIYRDSPLEVAKELEAHGMQYLHLVDLDGARSKHIVNYKTLYRIATHTSLKIDFGGGIKSDDDVRIAFENGAAQITGGSVAAECPEMFERWLEYFGSEKIILGADSNDRKIATHGWQQQSEIDVVDFISDYASKGVRYVICTDIDKDGMLQGTAIDLYKQIIDNIDVKLIASGGVSSIHDLETLQDIGCDGAIIGKAIYEGRISLAELEKLMTQNIFR